jgi:hypothetical protein
MPLCTLPPGPFKIFLFAQHNADPLFSATPLSNSYNINTNKLDNKADVNINEVF